VVVSGYEPLRESGETQLYRARDRRRLWTERFVVVALLAAGAIYFLPAAREDGWNVLWLAPVLIGVAGAWYLLERIVDPLVARLLRPFRVLGASGYSYYDEDEDRDPAPDYSMAERIPEDLK
jgi:peptidoglycan/LPS O-acetylase OafA/YrhL